MADAFWQDQAASIGRRLNAEAFSNPEIDHGVVIWNDERICCTPEYMYEHSYETANAKCGLEYLIGLNGVVFKGTGKRWKSAGWTLLSKTKKMTKSVPPAEMKLRRLRREGVSASLPYSTPTFSIFIAYGNVVINCLLPWWDMYLNAWTKGGEKG